MTTRTFRFANTSGNFTFNASNNLRDYSRGRGIFRHRAFLSAVAQAGTLTASLRDIHNYHLTLLLSQITISQILPVLSSASLRHCL